MRFMIVAGVSTMCIASTGVRYYGSKCFVVRILAVTDSSNLM